MLFVFGKILRTLVLIKFVLINNYQLMKNVKIFLKNVHLMVKLVLIKLLAIIMKIKLVVQKII